MAETATGARIVILDDEVSMGRVLTKLLRLEGHDPVAFDHPAEALAYIQREEVAVLLTDLRMPGLSGEEVLEAIRAAGRRTEVIVMTAYGTVDSAMRCVRAGAFDYVTKPFETAALLATVREAARRAGIAEAPAVAHPPATDKGWKLLGDSEAMETARGLIERFAPSASAVLIHGESGTGKELAARAIHRLSPRRDRRFVAVNCASIPETLIESELFGHEKGAFTGAHEARKGLFEAAEGGTLFLDEIGELPLAMQAKLLRALQEREITRVGSVENIRIDVRIVAATNRRLEEQVKAGVFREDLYYRLDVLSLRMPALRKRREDIPLLAQAFAKEFSLREKRPAAHVGADLAAALQGREWPGNVRELRNVMERLVVLGEGGELDARSLDILQRNDSGVHRDLTPATAPPPVEGEMAADGSITDFREARNQFEATYLRTVLKACKGNVTEAARKAGMSRRSLYEKIEKLEIGLEDFKEHS